MQRARERRQTVRATSENQRDSEHVLPLLHKRVSPDLLSAGFKQEACQTITERIRQLRQMRQSAVDRAEECRTKLARAEADVEVLQIMAEESGDQIPAELVISLNLLQQDHQTAVGTAERCLVMLCLYSCVLPFTPVYWSVTKLRPIEK